MNLLIPPTDFSKTHLFFSDSKENTVLNGNFIKLIYSSSFITINGIFIDFPIINPERKIYNGKQYLFFTPTILKKPQDTIQEQIQNKDIQDNSETEDKENIITIFERIESDILELFILNNIHRNPRLASKTINHTIYKQLKNGMIKFYQYSEIKAGVEPRYYMKISGIWETATEIGLTYKLIQY